MKADRDSTGNETTDHPAGDPDAARRRLGEMIKRARIGLGIGSRDALAETAKVSKRVIADLESGARDNFSGRVLARIEDTLGWARGTVDLIVSDPEFEPPAPASRDDAADLIFRPPNFDRRPVSVEVPAIEALISALHAAQPTLGENKLPDEVVRLAEAATSVCWPYIVRLVEDNCIPGEKLHPAAQPLYDAWSDTARLAPGDPAATYTAWLAGRNTDVSASIVERYRHRWAESRRNRTGRTARSDAASPQL